MVIQSNTCKEFLETLLVRRKRTNPRYSQRALARHLKLSAGELSEILRGIRPVTPKTAERIADALGFSAFETRYLMQMAERERTASPPPATAPNSFSSEKFALASDWFCWALLALTETEGFSWDQKKISARLGVSEAETRIAIANLQTLGILVAKEKGYAIRREAIVFEEGIPSEAVRQYHQQILKKAEAALEEQTAGEREFQSVTVAMNPALLPVLKKELGHFMDELGQRYGAGKKKTEVYQIELAAFRLTHRSGNEN